MAYSVLPRPCQCFNPIKIKRSCWVIFAWGVRWAGSRVARFQSVALDRCGVGAMHRHRGAREVDVGFGLEQINQETAAIKALVLRGPSPFIRCAQQLVGAFVQAPLNRAREVCFRASTWCAVPFVALAASVFGFVLRDLRIRRSLRYVQEK